MVGGNYNNDDSYFIEPTICEINNIDNWIWNTELFAPIVTIKTYNDNIFKNMIKCSQHKYGLMKYFF